MIEIEGASHHPRLPSGVACITGDTDVPFTQTANQANLHHECFLEDIRVAANDALTERALTLRRRTVHLRQADKGAGTLRTPCPGRLRSASRTFLPSHARRRVLWSPRVLTCRALLRLGGCGSFYAITIASEKLEGLPILKQHRRIKDVLKEDMAGLHGLQVRHSDSLIAHGPMNLCLLDLVEGR